MLNESITPPERQSTMRLPDGRVLAWHEWGPIDGLPVIFCSGAGLSGSLGFGADVLPALGLRLMALDRPGVGYSGTHPDKTLKSWVDDTRAWIAANGLHHVSAVAFSQGAPFGFALAARGIVEAVSIVSGQDELGHPRIRPLLHPDVEGMVAAIEGNAAEFEASFASIASADGLWHLIIGMSGDRDRALYTSESFGPAYKQALHEGFAQGSHGYVRDLINAMSAWPFNLETIRVPVDLWFGRLDRSTVHSPDFGATLATRLPNVSHFIDPDEGSSILWTRGQDILTKLKASL